MLFGMRLLINPVACSNFSYVKPPLIKKNTKKTYTYIKFSAHDAFLEKSASLGAIKPNGLNWIANIRNTMVKLQR